MAEIVTKIELEPEYGMSYRELLAFANTLKETVAQFQAINESLNESVSKLQSTIDSLNETIKQKDIAIKSLQEQLVYFKKQKFGSHSEQSSYLDGIQKNLFHSAASTEAQNGVFQEASKQEKTIHIPAHERKPKRSQEEIYANIPTEVEVIPIPEEVIKKYEALGMRVEEIGIEHVRFEIHAKPSELTRKDICATKYKVVDAKNETEKFFRTNVPAPLIEHSFVSPSLLLLIIANKYLAGLPLYRQEQIFKYQSFPITRTAMANWVITVCENHLKKLYLRLCRLIIEENVIHADETPIQVLKEPGKRPQQRSYMWVYATAKRSTRQIRCFVYENSRSGECAHAFLDEFIGILVSDGYAGYLKVEVIRAGCWAHMRRKWVEAKPTGVSSETSNAAIGLEYCNQLFAFERTVEMLSDDERLSARNKTTDGKGPKSAKEILHDYWQWIDSFKESNLSGKFKNAIVYAKNQRQYLNTFLDHGEIEISNNQAENTIRPLVIGRKNWLFSDTVKGAEASAILYSLLETAKANGLNPVKWLQHVLTELPERFAFDPNDKIDDLLPWTKQMQAKFRLV